MPDCQRCRCPLSDAKWLEHPSLEHCVKALGKKLSESVPIRGWNFAAVAQDLHGADPYDWRRPPRAYNGQSGICRNCAHPVVMERGGHFVHARWAVNLGGGRMDNRYHCDPEAPTLHGYADTQEAWGRRHSPCEWPTGCSAPHVSISKHGKLCTPHFLEADAQ